MKNIGTKEPPWYVRDLVLASILVLLGVLAAAVLDDRRSGREQRLEDERASQAARLENLRFVRQQSATPGSRKPFGGLDLRKMDLVGLDLQGAGFAGADLREANLVSSDLTKADLQYTRLTRADLNSAAFTNVFFVEVDMRWVNLALADLSGAVVQNSDLREANLYRTDLTRAQFNWSDLRGASLGVNSLIDIGEMPYADDPVVGEAVERAVEERLAQFDLHGTYFHSSDLREVDFSGADLRGVVFSSVRLAGAAFDGACWSDQDDPHTRNFLDITVWPDDFRPPKSGPCSPLPADYSPPPNSASLPGS